MIKYILLFISFVLEFVVLNYLNIHYLYPMFTVVTIVMIYNLFKEERFYNLSVLILSCFYGLIFLNNIFLGFLIFFIMKELVLFVNKKFDINFFMLLFFSFFCMILFDLLLYLFLFMPFNIFYVINKILRGIIINIVYMLFLYSVIIFSSK